MGPRYAQYYQRRLDAIGEGRLADVAPFSDEVRAAVRQGIDSASVPPPLEVRPDAELLLVVTLEELVLLPTTAVQPDESPAVLFDVIPGDVRIIVDEAARRAAARDDTEISGHEVLRVMADEWEQLAFAAPWRWNR